MWVIIGIIVISIIVAIMEVPPLWRKRQMKELLVFSLLFLMAIGLSISVNLDVNIPNPYDWITAIYQPFL